MAIGPGTRVGPYEVITLVGEGGMGTVWRAHHGALRRDAALKVLPEAFATDADRLDRFQREAQVLASLNHPNIAQVYGLEQAEGLQAIVMELVEGPTLADRVAAGPIPLAEALEIARQIAEALEAAHDQGIVHRDLKPANIKVRPDGTVKVLDFGLAKATEPATAASSGPSASPTITSPAMTRAGMILGTAAYMSPEQARGRPADHRSDIFSFGCVLYEMLTRRRAFGGVDVGETLAFVITREPEMGGVPRQVRTLVTRCLRKDRRQRLQAIGEARIALEALLRGELEDAGESPSANRQPLWAVAIVAVLATAVVGGFALWPLWPAPATPQRVTRFVLTSPPGVAPRGNGTGRHTLAISPQGTHVVYWANEQLFVRALDEIGDGLALGGTEGAREPFFSPDGQWVGFFDEGRLKRVSITGGATVALTEANAPWGASWEPDGTILYGQGEEGIWRASERGGAGAQLIAVEPGQAAHGPQMLPGTRWVLFTLKPAGTDSWDEAQVVAQSLDTGERAVTADRGRDARYLPSTGHLVYGLNGVLLAAPFDVLAQRITGNAVPVVERVMDSDVRTGAMQFSVSAEGTLVYLAGALEGQAVLTWVTRDGDRQRLAIDPREFSAPRIAPDGSKVAVAVGEARESDLYVYDLARNVRTQLTAPQLRGRHPLWTPDGGRLVFYSDADGGGMFSLPADGSGNAARLTRSASEQMPSSWTPDGQTLVFEESASWPDTSASDIFMVSLGSDKGPEKLLATAAFEGQPMVSPDGRWLAYTSNESGGLEVYVRPFPEVQKARWSVSSDGGHSPLWAPDGQQLFFIARGRAMSVSVQAESAFRPGSPTAAFELSPLYRSMFVYRARLWDIGRDGRLLVIDPAGDTGGQGAQARVLVVRNWFDELKRLVPTNAPR